LRTGTDSLQNSFVQPREGAGGGKVECDVTSLESYCRTNEIESIDLLKIDVEGFELEVLAGAEDLLAKGLVRFVYAEFHTAQACLDDQVGASRHRTDLRDLIDLLGRHRMRLITIYTDSVDLGTAEGTYNALFGPLDLRHGAFQTSP
jgi:hypothetical protein